MTWRLDNVEDRAAEHPDTFGLHPLAKREALVFGDFAKLIFVSDAPPAGERMWVKVTEILDGGFRGETVDDAATMGIPAGTLVRFGPEHVCDIQLSDTLASVFAREKPN